MGISRVKLLHKFSRHPRLLLPSTLAATCPPLLGTYSEHPPQGVVAMTVTGTIGHALGVGEKGIT